MNYIVQTVTASKNSRMFEVSTFSTLEMAKAWADNHPTSLVFRREQVARIIGSKLLLKSNDWKPANR
jgi:hypothetical protein